MSSQRCVYSLVFAFAMATISSGATIVHSDQAVLLSSLLDAGQTIEVGDKVFADFTYSPVGDMPPATAVNVIPIVADGDYGLRFQGGFIDLPGGGASDSLITFSVEAPAPWITGAYLSGNVDASGSGIASITETFLPDFVNTALTIASGINLVDSVMFDPVQKLSVQKDILLLSTDDANATLSFVDQSFPQVPEPSAGLMFVFGALGLFGSRRRRS